MLERLARDRDDNDWRRLRHVQIISDRYDRHSYPWTTSVLTKKSLSKRKIHFWKYAVRAHSAYRSRIARAQGVKTGSSELFETAQSFWKSLWNSERCRVNSSIYCRSCEWWLSRLQSTEKALMTLNIMGRAHFIFSKFLIPKPASISWDWRSWGSYSCYSSFNIKRWYFCYPIRS